MELRKSNQKIQMNKPPKTEIELLKEKVENLDKKLDKIIILVKVKKSLDIES